VTLRRLFTPRRLATGGAVVLGGIVGLALFLQNGGSACAAPPSTSGRSGIATYFDLEGKLGNCSYPSPPADDLFVALSIAGEYSAGAGCGTYLDVTGPKGKVRVKVIDSCPPCEVGHIDLSLTAFKKIGVQEDGIIKVKYRTVANPAVPGPLSVRVKEGSSRYWLSILIDNHGNQLKSVKVAGGGGSYQSAQREEWNYWTLPSGAGSGPFKVRITDVYGHTATLSGIELAVGRTQKTTVRLSGSSSSSSSSGPVKAAPRKKATPSPSPSTASPSVSVPVSPAAPPEETTSIVETPPQTPVDLAAAPDAESCG
jgi:expansin